MHPLPLLNWRRTKQSASASVHLQSPRHQWLPGSVFRVMPKQDCRLMEMWGICFSRTRRWLSNPSPPRLLGEPTSLLKQETFSFSRKTVRSETHACQMEEHMYKLGLIGLFSSLLWSHMYRFLYKVKTTPAVSQEDWQLMFKKKGWGKWRWKNSTRYK